MSWLRRLAAEPLLQFTILGALLWAAAETAPFEWGPRGAIHIDRGQVEAALAGWERSSGRVATGPEREALIAQLVDTELLLAEARRRELHRRDPVVRQRLRRNLEFIGGGGDGGVESAFALGMDRGDPVVRRRLVQLMRHRIESEVRLSPAEYQAWSEAHPELFRAQARYTVEQRFFSRDARGDPGARQAALAALDDPAQAGDPFLLGGTILSRDIAAIAARYGEAFAAQVAAADKGVWHGPVASVYGWHVLRVVAIDRLSPAADPALLHRAFADREQAHLRAILDGWRSRYRIVVAETET